MKVQYRLMGDLLLLHHLATILFLAITTTKLIFSCMIGKRVRRQELVSAPLGRRQIATAVAPQYRLMGDLLLLSHWPTTLCRKIQMVSMTFLCTIGRQVRRQGLVSALMEFKRMVVALKAQYQVMVDLLLFTHLPTTFCRKIQMVHLMLLCTIGRQVETTRVSVSSDGVQANGWSFPNAISSDGRFVVFISYADNLVPDDTNGEGDAFVHDRQTGETTRVSISSDGVQGNNRSGGSGICADGRFVVFSSGADNLVPDDTNGEGDAFVHDQQTGETTRVSVSSDGFQANKNCGGGGISADGRFVVLSSKADNLVPNDTNGQNDVFVHDRQTGETTRVSVSSYGFQANGNSFGGGISADGRLVVFGSEAFNLVPDDTNGEGDAFVHDLNNENTLETLIDIIPGIYPNIINLGFLETIPAAIITTESLHAIDVDPTTCLFEGASAVSWNMVDVDEDGDSDLVLHFNIQSLGLNRDSTQATLIGQTYSKRQISGADSVVVIPIESVKTGQVIQITDNENDDGEPQIHNGQVVWVTEGGGIIFWDGKNTPQGIGGGYHPQLNKGQVVWRKKICCGPFYGTMFWDGSGPAQLLGDCYDLEEPQIHNGQVVWSDSEINLWDGTGNKKFGDGFEPQIHEGKVVWRHESDIFFWNGVAVQLTDDEYWQDGPQIHNGQVVWSGDDGNDKEIYLWDGSGIQQLTDNNYDDLNPQIHNGQVVWVGETKEYGIGDIFYWDGSTIRQLTGDIYANTGPQIDRGQVVWERQYDPDYGGAIFYWNGSSIQSIGNGKAPQIHNGQVVWAGYDGNDSEIFLWTGDILEVIIDILPGSYPNNINIESEGDVLVTILTTDDFNAKDVEPATCVFAGAPQVNWNMNDVDNDGDADMDLYFNIQELNLTTISTEATLIGKTFANREITGTDSVNIISTEDKPDEIYYQDNIKGNGSGGCFILSAS